MNFVEQCDLISNGIFQKQIRMAILKVATIIINEDCGTYSSTEYKKRTSLAYDTLIGKPDEVYRRFLEIVAAAGGVSVGAEDAEVELAITTLWNAVAGVTMTDKAT